MDLIDEISSRATLLCTLCEEVKGNKKQCQRLAQRVKGLDKLMQPLKQNRAGQNSGDVEVVLGDLNETLQSAAEVVLKYTSDSFHEHVCKDYHDSSEFRSLNGRLKSAFDKLSEALQVDRDHELRKMFEEASQHDEADRKEDHEELRRIMDLIDPIVSTATSLYHFCEEVKGNKKQCQRLAQRVKGLDKLVQPLKQNRAGQNSGDVKEALGDLNETLQSAAEVVLKYISDSFHEHVCKDYHDSSEFRSLNGRLKSAFDKLSEALQVDRDHELRKMFEEASQHDEADRKEDHKELKRIMDLIDDISAKAASLSPLCENAARNQKRRECLKEHVKVLKEHFGAIKEKGPGPNSADVEEALRELQTTVESEEVAAFVKEYNSTWTATDYGNEFDSLNNGLDDALNKLTSALPFDQSCGFEVVEFLGN